MGWPPSLLDGAVTIGNFDGVHRGHARIVAELLAQSNWWVDPQSCSHLIRIRFACCDQTLHPRHSPGPSAKPNFSSYSALTP